MRTAAALRIAMVLAIAALGVPGSAPAATTLPSPEDCRPIRVPTHRQVPFAPTGVSSCPGVRPGALVETPIGFCTLNFLFYGTDGYRYIGTAGHCILGDPEDPFRQNVGERVWARGTGPIAKDANGRAIGRFRYAVLKEPRDFALIQLGSTIKATPRLCWFGGPTAMTNTKAAMQVLHHYGQGMGTGDLLPARTAYAHSMPSSHHVYGWGAIAPGDSGSPVVTDSGKAVGVIVTFGIHATSLADSGVMGITRLPSQLARAKYMTNVGYRLATAGLSQQL